VETGWDDLLRGYDPGKLTYYFRTRNNPLVKPPQRQDLQLTIDSELQRYASKELSDAVQAWGGAGGAAVFYDAVTGEVLCAATAPSFDPNGLTLERMQNYVAANPRTQVLVNKALARDALYYPGSCFKILTAATGLEHSVTGDITCVNGHNAEPITWEWENTRWKRAPGRIRDYGAGGHGPLRIPDSMDRALAASCNVYFAKLATEIGPERFRQAMQNAELQDIPKSTRALAEHLDAAGFGQIAMKTSPFEMARLAGAFSRARQDLGDDAGARPHWVKAIVTNDHPREPDDHLFGAPNRMAYRPFSSSAAARVREMMVGVVQNPGGTAHEAFYAGGAPRLQGITVGGKTGTAEFEKTAGKRKTIGRHAWFVGFARSDHELQPRTIAFAVLLEDVRRGATGGGACAPLPRRNIERNLPQPGANSALKAGDVSHYYPNGEAPTPGALGPVVDWFKRLFKH
jgi:cell division protein FtsI/penicillin-binding protein 2